MRLLMLTDDYLPHRGGSRVYYHELFLRLARAGAFDATILTRSREGDSAFDAKQPYRVVRRPLEESRWLRPIRLQQLPVYMSLLRHGRKIVHERRPDAIIAGELVPTGPVAALLAKRLSAPLIVWTHAEGPATLARTRVQSRLARWVCSRATRLVAASENARLGLITHMGADPDRVVVILPGVGDEHFDPHYAARPHSAPFTAERPARLLTVGRLIERKGHVSVLRSLARVREVVGPLRYSIIGTGHTAGLLRATIRELGLEDTVEMRGEVGPEELLDAYRDADIFVLPNLDNPDTGDTEGFVIALGEASAHGLPVVGGRAGGTAHSVVDGETGLLVDGQNSNEVGEAVARILFEPGLAQRMGDAGRAHARDTMNWERRLPKFIELLEDEAGGETPRRTA